MKVINTTAESIFSFKDISHPFKAITSTRSQQVIDWVMTLSEQPDISEQNKIRLLDDFIRNLTSDPDLLSLTKFTEKQGPGTFWSEIHPSIISIAKNKYIDGYYADAIESALKEVNSRVKNCYKTNTSVEKDGADLMNCAFSPKSPIITLDDLTTESGKNVQQGYMQIFAGSMIGIRNPKAHSNIVIDTKRALHLIFLASLLMYKLDDAGVPL